ncbi:hypothetical protein ACFY1P_20650 [Streptomyces sp. NPDC001407]|uniref:hypothetical protein n=1 Tax=Streptomyces sp. NPDC001407 TaxID=3364573 RepID=UPI0036B1548F
MLTAGCTSGSHDGGAKAGGTSTDASAKPSASSTSASSASRAPYGMWYHQEGSEIFRVSFFYDHVIADSPKGVCSGQGKASGPTTTFALKCPTSDNPRAKGAATLEDDGKTLTVRWDGGITETYGKNLKVETPKIDIPEIKVSLPPTG